MKPMRKNADRPAPDDGWLSVLHAARLLGCAPQTVVKRALKGELESQFVAGRTVVSRASVERALAAATTATATA